jgi:hypothetical protein
MSIAKEFILAAERHKVVCEKLLAMPELLSLQQEEHLLANNSNEWRLLADIYYLTGYVIECSCCAAIYSFYTTTLTNKKDLKANTIAHYKVAFTYKKDDPPAELYVSNENHFLVKKATAFHAFPSVFGDIALTIPILNGHLTEFTGEQLDLLKNWNAEIRYKVMKDINPDARLSKKILPLTYKGVVDFFNTSKKIYEKVVITFQP